MSDAICSLDWCDRNVGKAGLCNMHYLRKRRGQPMDAPPKQTKPVGVPCEMTGCDRPAVSHGLCNAHRLRVRRGGDMAAPVREFAKSVAERLDRGLPDRPTGACWVWQGATDGDGYGVVHAPDVGHRAHRAAYAEWVGPIPAGMFICHRCDNPPCCNPDHLFVGNPQDNAIDMVSKKRHGKYNPNAKQPRSSRRAAVDGRPNP